jgi:anti-sigma B factor antagonist
MEMTWRFVNGVVLLDLKGRLTTGAADLGRGSLRVAVAELTAGGCVDIALNLAGLTALDAGGLGELVLALRAAREHGGRLTLVAPLPRVRRMLAVTRLDTVFDVCGTEAELRARRTVPLPDLTAAVNGEAAYA